VIGKATPAGAGFKGLVSYLMRGRREAPDPDRVAWAGTRNLIVDDPDLALRIMRATASRSDRCTRPVYHLVVSWHEHEQPTPEQMRLVADRTLADLELSEHQAILIAHRDTPHQHLHVVVNRVHPDTHIAWRNSHDWRKIEVSLARQAGELGFLRVPGRHNEPEAFRDVAMRPRYGEVRRAERLGTEPVRPRLTREQIAERRPRLTDTIDRAHSWAELDRALTADGYDIAAKGQGLVIGDAGGTLKLSQLRTNIRLGALEQRFGESFAAFDKRREGDRRLAEMSREQRLAELARQREQRPPANPPASADDTAGQGGLQREQELPPSAPTPSREKQHGDDLHGDLKRAREATDLAFTLHRAGLATKSHVKHALEDKTRAEQALDKDAAFDKRLARELRHSLKAKTSGQPRSRGEAEKAPRKSRTTDRDRER
jgi:hypothetical protein